MATPRERMVRLLSLLQSGRQWAADDLAAAMDTTPRTLRRDIEHLRGQGYPVESTRGPGGHYRLVAGAALPPLMLEDDEAVASVLGLRFIAAGGSGLDFQSEAADRAIAKLRRILPAPLRRTADRVLAAIELDSTSHPQPSSDIVRVLADAITSHQLLTFDYHRGEQTMSRTVEPYRIVRIKGRWYHLCWDTDRDDWRTFRLDRITTPTPTDTVLRDRSHRSRLPRRVRRATRCGSPHPPRERARAPPLHRTTGRSNPSATNSADTPRRSTRQNGSPPS